VVALGDQHISCGIRIREILSYFSIQYVSRIALIPDINAFQCRSPLDDGLIKLRPGLSHKPRLRLPSRPRTRARPIWVPADRRKDFAIASIVDCFEDVLRRGGGFGIVIPGR
jgi:hypothetical protein